MLKQKQFALVNGELVNRKTGKLSRIKDYEIKNNRYVYKNNKLIGQIGKFKSKKIENKAIELSEKREKSRERKRKKQERINEPIYSETFDDFEDFSFTQKPNKKDISKDIADIVNEIKSLIPDLGINLNKYQSQSANFKLILDEAVKQDRIEQDDADKLWEKFNEYIESTDLENLNSEYNKEIDKILDSLWDELKSKFPEKKVTYSDVQKLIGR